jgi:hypothetical protein
MTGDRSDRRSYIHTVGLLYRALPDTPDRFSRTDRDLAGLLFDRGVQISTIRSAFLLATARRLVRSSSRPPLQPVRSLHYFLPVIDEVQQSPLPPSYLRYLESKLPAIAQKSSLFDAR